ncbi:MAG: ABC transporter ATP-binding protein [Acidobacteria bacterium]|nr:ABC transporter ATP-binding protein [Acidobacteriota bacterium]
MEPIIDISDLNKKYAIYARPFDRVKELMMFGRRSFHQELWALQDIQLRVRPGESIGFIGSNGAGKSTLLKMISGISSPTSGRLAVRGRISALMELGAGFHDDFTGRENIYMNCSILGMSREQINRKLDEIIAFSELGEFIDRPIKIYSTGMFMRLGFSVAINTEPDILLIDEILAVGDEYFQTKCYDKIKEFRSQGKTVIFVSHSTNTVRGLCERAVWLEGGRIHADGDSVEVTDLYLNFQRNRIGQRRQQEGISEEASPPGADAATLEPAEPAVEIPALTRQGTREGEIHKVEILDGNEQPRDVFDFGETIIIRLHFRARGRVPNPNVGVSIWRNDNILSYGSSSAKDAAGLEELPANGYVDYVIPDATLMNGDYEVSAAIFCPDDIHPYDFHNRLYHFQVRCRRRDEGVTYLRHYYRYVFDNGRTVITREADMTAPRRR